MSGALSHEAYPVAVLCRAPRVRRRRTSCSTGSLPSPVRRESRLALAPYTPGFREEAVHLHCEQGGSIAESARRLGLHTETLRKRVRQAEVDAGERAGATREEHEEIVRLKRERRARVQQSFGTPTACAASALRSRAPADATTRRRTRTRLCT